jgi:glycosyltransferase involved in cell wall biosynthesis
MTKIVVVGSYAESLIQFRGHLLIAMVEAGWSVICAAPRASQELQNELKQIGVKYYDSDIDRNGFNILKDVRTFFQFTSLFRRLRPDIVLSYTIKPVIYASLAARITKVPNIYSIITGLGYAFTGKGARNKLVSRIVSLLYHLSMRCNVRVFFQNPDDRNIFINRKYIRNIHNAIIINGSGVDIDYYRPAKAPVTVSFLLMARLIKEKGIMEYVAAARAIKTVYPEIKFCIAGPLENRPGSILRSQLDKWIISGTINYLGVLKDVRPSLRSAAVYVLPSYREGTPRSILEAMAVGRPVITTNAPGCRETVVDGENGFLVPVGDSKALADRMKYLLENPSVREAMGKRSRDIVIRKYDVNDVNSNIMRILSK